MYLYNLFVNLKILLFDRFDMQNFDILVSGDCQVMKKREVYCNKMFVDDIKIIVLLNCCYVYYND